MHVGPVHHAGAKVVALGPDGLATNWAAQLLETEATMGCWFFYSTWIIDLGSSLELASSTRLTVLVTRVDNQSRCDVKVVGVWVFLI